MRLGIAAYVVPFVFALHPALILKGTLGEILLAVTASSIGTFLLAVGCAGYLFRPLTGQARLFCLAACCSCPHWHGTWLIMTPRVAIGVKLFLWERSRSSPRHPVPSPAPSLSGSGMQLHETRTE
jgi:TRAP-type uncharacterized transport system fused permease subunit